MGVTLDLFLNYLSDSIIFICNCHAMATQTNVFGANHGRQQLNEATSVSKGIFEFQRYLEQLKDRVHQTNGSVVTDSFELLRLFISQS